MRSRSYYLGKTKRNIRTGTKPCDGKRVSQEPQLISDILERAQDLDVNLKTWDLEDGIRWFLGFNNYVSDKTKGFSGGYDSYTFYRGQIVYVDFFGHFGTELTYDHPAIVLADKGEGIVIAPLSSACFMDEEETHVDLPKKRKNLGDLPYSSGIKLEQIRYISKTRVMQKFGRVSNTPKLNEIDHVLMEYISPKSYDFLVKNQDYLTEEVKKRDKEIEEKENEVNRLKRHITLIEKQLRDESEGLA
ncbi:type II toxin-antitoxin system PemK/MazF family toxin [Pseudalkalibacillus sp. JSM 102089]|uniref:type II toxin-antitoxin system PemK/MazF family toxin n=1 Tax=Pseudalkalibacillus sp. JSM 102089 TaxID=3229856 RepID=UPI0035268206